MLEEEGAAVLDHCNHRGSWSRTSQSVLYIVLHALCSYQSVAGLGYVCGMRSSAYLVFHYRDLPRTFPPVALILLTALCTAGIGQILYIGAYIYSCPYQTVEDRCSTSRSYLGTQSQDLSFISTFITFSHDSLWSACKIILMGIS